jgi:hypothetical protein
MALPGAIGCIEAWGVMIRYAQNSSLVLGGSANGAPGPDHRRRSSKWSAAGSVKVIVNHCSSGTVILNDPTKDAVPYDFQNYEEYHNHAMNENSTFWFDWTAQWGQLR